MAIEPQSACITYDAQRDCLTLTVHVQPGAKTSALAGRHGDALKIRMAAPAVDNKANDALIAFLAVSLGLRPAQIRIRQGGKGRRKVIDITAADAAMAARVRAVLAPQ